MPRSVSAVSHVWLPEACHVPGVDGAGLCPEPQTRFHGWAWQDMASDGGGLIMWWLSPLKIHDLTHQQEQSWLRFFLNESGDGVLEEKDSMNYVRRALASLFAISVKSRNYFLHR